MRLDRRVAELEKHSMTSDVQFVVCLPIRSQNFQGTEIAPGIFINRFGYPDRKNTRCVCYVDRDYLTLWLAQPEQMDALHCIYRVLTIEEH